MKQYDHKKIEKKWQKEWDKKKAHVVKDKVARKKNEYLLTEFAYPSGNLHVGHWYAFAVPDIYGRFRRAQGMNVLYPMGFDAFGLPAENAAIKNKLNPRTWTYANIKHMKAQLTSMGAAFDWSREVITCDPDYYRWTQWQFLQFYKKGLAYQKETAANWCPNDKTVLANEQVVAGHCERCGAEVEQRQMLQWNLRITDYADRLVDDLDKLDWPEQIKEAQRNWIGRSEGAEIDFLLDFGDPVINDRVGPDGKKARITVFTTRPDTLFGATYIVLAPEHPWVTFAIDEAHKGILKNRDAVIEYVTKANKKSDLERQENKEKTGVKIEGVCAINPATGEKIPMYVADYVLGHYGTGAVMAVPAHDERDFEFAKKFDLPIKQVIMPQFVDEKNPPQEGKRTEVRRMVHGIVRDPKTNKILCLKWKKQPWTSFVIGGAEEGEDLLEAVKREIYEETGFKNLKLVKVLGGMVQSEYYAAHKDENRLGFSTGFYFELIDNEQTPLSPEESDKHEIIWRDRKDITRATMTCAEVDEWFKRIDSDNEAYTGEGVLVNSGDFDKVSIQEAKKAITEKFGRAKKTYRLRDWGVSRQRYWGVPIPIIHCDTCGAVPVPDKGLPVKLPEVKDYLPDGNGQSPLAKAVKWVNVKCPKCKGKAHRETDTLDTFVDSSWYFLRYLDPKNKKQFADKKKQATWMPIDLYSGGAEHTTMHLLYSRFWYKALYDLKLVKGKEPYTRRMNRGLILGHDGAKMSKSKGNVIDPDAVVAQLGADTVRLYLAFIGPYNEAGSYPWNPDSIVGVRRFLERVWRLRQEQSKIKGVAFYKKATPFISVADKDVERALHQTIKKVGEDCAEMKFNTAISQMMIFLNLAEDKGITHAQYATFIRLLAPFAPHITEELWQEIGNKKSVHIEPWPKFDKKKLISDTITIMIQINGKTRGEVQVAATASKEDIEKAAREAVAERLAGQTTTRTIVVPGRLVNFVVTS